MSNNCLTLPLLMLLILLSPVLFVIDTAIYAFSPKLCRALHSCYNLDFASEFCYYSINQSKFQIPSDESNLNSIVRYQDCLRNFISPLNTSASCQHCKLEISSVLNFRNPSFEEDRRRSPSFAPCNRFIWI